MIDSDSARSILTMTDCPLVGPSDTDEDRELWYHLRGESREKLTKKIDSLTDDQLQERILVFCSQLAPTLPGSLSTRAVYNALSDAMQQVGVKDVIKWNGRKGVVDGLGSSMSYDPVVGNISLSTTKRKKGTFGDGGIAELNTMIVMSLAWTLISDRKSIQNHTRSSLRIPRTDDAIDKAINNIYECISRHVAK